ncbi:MAG: replicative DNA helicase [Spirochaetales bacterium]|nr:replicative DNA helicase [Spirochaetales bacterium]
MADGSLYKSNTLPHDDEAEKAVLGAILLNSSVLETAMEIVQASDFYHHGNQIIFQSFVDYAEKNQAQTLDLVSIINFLKSNNSPEKNGGTLLERCGGVAYVSTLTDSVSNTASLQVHAQIVHDLAKRRNLITLSQNFISSSYDQSREITDILLEASGKLSDLEQDEGESSGDRTIKPFLKQAVSLLQSRMKGAKSDNLETGFDRLDTMTDGGFHPTDFIIIAARPSIGKTAFCTSIIQNMIQRDYKVVFYSLEMSGVQVVQRLLTGISKVPLKSIRNATFTGNRDPNFMNVMNAASKLFDSKLFIYDIPNMKLSDIRASARRLKREQDIQAIFIDYIGLVDAGLPSTVARFEQVAHVSRSLKALARDLKIPVVVLCQVSRDAEGDKNEPQLNNLRDSGAIEQDADMVMFLHRARKIDDEKLVNGMQPTKIIVAKQRNGETGEFKVGFKKDTASFENILFDIPDDPSSSGGGNYRKN